LIYLILFLGWFYFNLNSHSCNTCMKSQKNISCRSLNTYLSKYLCGVNLGFLLSFCANANSFVFNHLSISTFIGFYDLNIPFLYLHSPHASSMDLIHSIPCKSNRKRNHLLVITLSIYFLAEPGSDMNRFPTKSSKTISPHGKPEGNTTHKMYYAVSPEMVLWVAAKLKCL